VNDNLTQVLVLLITTIGTIGLAYVKLRAPSADKSESETTDD
jgi:hypothetical protein